MAMLSTVADSASWSSLTIALVVSVLVGGVILYFNSKRLLNLTKEGNKPTGQVFEPVKRQLHFGRETHRYLRLEDGKVDRSQTSQVNIASSIPCDAVDHRQPITSIVASDAQHMRMTPSSSIAGVDGDSQFQGTTTLISDESMLPGESDVNTRTYKLEAVGGAEDQRDRRKYNQEQKHAAQRNNEQSEQQSQEVEEGRCAILGLPYVDAQRLGRHGLVVGGAVDTGLRGVGSMHQWPDGEESRMQEMSQELIVLMHGPSTEVDEAQQQRDARAMPEMAEVPGGAALWRLAVDRNAVTEEMVEVILKVAPTDDSEPFGEA